MTAGYVLPCQGDKSVPETVFPRRFRPGSNYGCGALLLLSLPV